MYCLWDYDLSNSIIPIWNTTKYISTKENGKVNWTIYTCAIYCMYTMHKFYKIVSCTKWTKKRNSFRRWYWFNDISLHYNFHLFHFIWHSSGLTDISIVKTCFDRKLNVFLLFDLSFQKNFFSCFNILS